MYIYTHIYAYIYVYIYTSISDHLNKNSIVQNMWWRYFYTAVTTVMDMQCSKSEISSS